MLEVELEVLLQGVYIAKTMDIKLLSIKGDCLILVDNLQNATNPSWEYMPQWKSFLSYLEYFEEWSTSIEQLVLRGSTCSKPLDIFCFFVLTSLKKVPTSYPQAGKIPCAGCYDR